MTTIKRLIDVQLKELNSQIILDTIVKRDHSIKIKDGDKIIAIIEPYNYWSKKLEQLKNNSS